MLEDNTMIHFDTISNVTDLLSNSSLSAMPAVTLIILLSVVAMLGLTLLVEAVLSLVQAKKFASIEDELSVWEEDEVFACGMAEDVDLQSYLDGEVRVYNRAKSGKFYCRQQRFECKAKVEHYGAQITEVESVSYETTHEVEECCFDNGETNPHLEFVAFAQNVIESKAFELIGLARTRAVQNGLVAMAALALAYVLPAAGFIDDVVAMPTAIKELKAENAELRESLARTTGRQNMLEMFANVTTRKMDRIETTVKTNRVMAQVNNQMVTKVVARVVDPTDCPDVQFPKS